MANRKQEEIFGQESQRQFNANQQIKYSNLDSGPNNVPVYGAQNPNQDFKVGKSDYDLSAAAHPVACIFTFLFKALAVTIYFFGGLILRQSKIMVFILVVLMSAFDFWTVKNVTGRLLVGLRWWSDFDADGKEIWKFESYDQQFKTNGVDSAFFWTSQLLSTLFWAVWLVFQIFGLSVFYGMLVFINLCLSAINLYGYYKCKGEHSKKINALKGRLGQQGFMHLANRFMK